MDADRGSRAPRGFRGRVDGWSGFHGVAAPGRADGSHADATLVLPAQAVHDGPFLRMPEGSFEAIVVDGLAEGFGDLERFLAQLTAHLEPGGRLFVDAINLHAVPGLRLLLEGGPGRSDPFGAVRYPERQVSPERLLEAAEGAGLLCEDVAFVPGGESIDPELPASLLGQGFRAVRYAGGAPPVRLWLACARRAAAPGTALIGPGPAAQQDRTERALRAFLPEAWELRRCTGADEVQGFNRAVADSSGEVLWFLRAGAVAGSDLFDDLLARTLFAPARPRSVEDGVEPGDVSGLMLPRLDALLAGPIDEGFASPALAYEDWQLRLESLGKAPETVVGKFATPPAETAPSFARESAELLSRWQAFAGAGGDDPPSVPGPATAPAPVEPPPWQGRRPRISLCMIARDEERFLAECLGLAAPAVDEIVLVDTGSTDGTVAIAESFGARVIHQAWRDDFATPRNLSIEAATGDWILVLDADEFLDPAAVPALREAALDATVCGYLLPFENVDRKGRSSSLRMVRLFRKLPDVRFEFRFHEQITPRLLAAAGPRGLRLAYLDAGVEHRGYDDEVMASRNKVERNLRMFELALADHPDEVYLLYKYGDFLRSQPGHGGEALEVLERAFAMLLGRSNGCSPGVTYAAEVAALCAYEHLSAGAWERAAQVLEQALRHFVATPNLHYIAAIVALRRARPGAALRHFRECLRNKDRVLAVPIQQGITGHVAMTGIAQAFLMRGARDKARRLLRQSLAIEPDSEATVTTLAQIRAEDGDPGEALALLSGFLRVRPESAAACEQATRILAALGRDDAAGRMGARAIELLTAGGQDAAAARVEELLAGAEAGGAARRG